MVLIGRFALYLTVTMKLATSLLLPFVAGLIGSVSTVSEIPTWYANLNKPSFSPPNAIFGPVWTILYVMMGFSLYLFWKAANKGVLLKGMLLFGSQLVLNTLWSILFFGAKSPLLALINIVVLWVLILATILHFYKTSKTAAYLLVPYILWISFATILNFAIWSLN